MLTVMLLLSIACGAAAYIRYRLRPVDGSNGKKPV
jgi:hypothetical protein